MTAIAAARGAVGIWGFVVVVVVARGRGGGAASVDDLHVAVGRPPAPDGHVRGGQAAQEFLHLGVTAFSL